MPEGGKYILWCVLAVIAILIVANQLGLNPTEVSTGTVSVKFGIAPTSAAPVQNTDKLETKIRELQAQIENSRSEPNQPYNSPVTPQSPRVPRIDGVWKSNLYTVQFTQSGNEVAMAVYMYGIVTAAGKGYLSGRNLQINYLNSAMLLGTISATVSEDNSRLDVVDSAGGYQQTFVLYR